ncbi:CYFA0S15e01728g1_1 [Cyberlindnera fabianii]|uniref:CYFA0S15e01728g1_1 n=1 Tax=Cyberlindnera fabianii TaxID=36022 RepID=A0A061B5E3_CYBFA|nr:CYFA0S15e01728g1_1 [Cyberlindnera fabianii]
MLPLLPLFWTLVACQINIQLQAQWENPPFSLRLLETVSSENESYYLPALSKIAGFSVYIDDDDDAEGIQELTTDESLYHAVFDLLTPAERALFDIPLANKYHSPRIISHYKHYTDSVVPVFEKKVTSKCGNHSNTWLKFNDVVYCNPDDVYALMTDSSSTEELVSFDRLIGSSGPILVLYSNVEDVNFRPFARNLYEGAQAGKLRFVVRYIPQGLDEKEVLSGYGIDLTLKRTDYIVIDDRDILREAQEPLGQGAKSNGALLNVHDEDIKAVGKEDIKNLGLQLSSYVMDLEDDETKLNTLVSIMEELPKYTSHLVKKEITQSFLDQVNYNQKLGISSTGTGIFINGRLLDEDEQTVFGLYDVIKDELQTVQSLGENGLNSTRSRQVIEKFALLSLYKSRSRPSTRYKLPADDSSPIVFFNDIENEQLYSSYSTDVASYIGRFQMGQIPEARTNLQTLIFMFDLSDSDHLSILNSVVQAVRSNGIAQRVGVIPLPLTEHGTTLANNLIHISKTGGMASSRKFIKSLQRSGAVPEEVTDMDYVSSHVRPFMERFDVNGPVLSVNGAFHDFDNNWVYSMTRQVGEDVNFVFGMAYQKAADTFEEVSEMFYEDALDFRNTILFPNDKSEIKYRLYDTTKKLGNVFEFTAGSKGNHLATLTLAGDYGSEFTLTQLREILTLALDSNWDLKVRMIHTSDGVSFLGRLHQALNKSVDHGLAVLDEILHEKQFSDAPPSPLVLQALSSMGVESSSFLLLNGRYVELKDRLIKAIYLKSFVQTEIDQRLSVIQDLLRTDLPASDNIHDWFENVSSLVTLSYYGESQFGAGSIPRFDLSRVKTEHSISFGERSQSLLHILAVIDPAQELSQRLISLIKAIKGLEIISVDIVLTPQQDMDALPVKRFYKGNVKGRVEFKDGSLWEEPFVTFENVPSKTLFTLDMDVPASWIVIPKKSRSDLDNVLLSQSGPVTGVYELESITIEGNAFDAVTNDPPTGLALQIDGSDTSVMTNLGYFQLKANPGIWNLSIKEGRSSDLYDLVSESELSLFTLKGLHIRSSMKKKSGREGESLLSADEDAVIAKDRGSKLTSWFSRDKKKKKQADINIFSVASGHLYERLLSIMTVSVMRHTSHTVKFWLIDNYMSPSFREFLPYLAEKYGFEYELITYKWPSWLRSQREKQRTIWGYKILFLDVLFPQDLEKVIFVDADQIVRTDMIELVEMDLEGAPYGYTPMGDSRKEMEGFRFWKQGYWKKFLGDNLKYHISALYVIDLKKFRSIAAGDLLRQHYQALSRDPESLSNLDQDLPNNLQQQLKIFSLPQDWLWCETWCDDESLKTAKTIDLCNNPLTKEPKLDRARRQIPEWTVYDDEISALMKETVYLGQGIGDNEKESKAEEEVVRSEVKLNDYLKDEPDLEHDEL